MKKYLKYNLLISFIILYSFNTVVVFTQFAPIPGSLGTTAIHKDSSIFINWATNCSVNLGLEDISNPQSAFVSSGNSSMAIGFPGNGIISLGDGGEAILTFENPIMNGNGWDFAVFENSFSDTYLELGFVEVSSNGHDFYRFEATSLTQDSIQIDAFGSVNTEKINNLAGKYRVNYGTPFDLEELAFEIALDINHITHLKIIDVVGSIDPNYGSYDHLGNLINDPFPTPYPSSGFDLDAVGVIHEQPLKIKNEIFIENFKCYNGLIEFTINEFINKEFIISIVDINGKNLIEKIINNIDGKFEFKMNLNYLKSGLYLMKINAESEFYTRKIFIQ